MGIYDDLIGKHVIVRADHSGVHFGTLTAYDGDTVRLKDSRRLWKWHVAGTGISLSEVAITGVDQGKSRITMTLPDLVVMGACEIIPCHGMAVATIMNAPVSEAE